MLDTGEISITLCLNGLDFYSDNMNRKDFLKRIGLGAAAAMVAPKIIAEVIPEESPISEDIFNANNPVISSDYLRKHPRTPDESFIYKYVKEVISEEEFICSEENHYIRNGDGIIIFGDSNDDCFRAWVSSVDGKNIKIKPYDTKDKLSIRNRGGYVETLWKHFTSG